MWALEDTMPKEITKDNIDFSYEVFHKDAISDGMGEIRGGEVETTLSCKSSDHYESKSVASKMLDGSWVGWTYWYGGGKHGLPESINWIDDAYDLECIETQKVVTIQTFSKIK